MVRNVAYGEYQHNKTRLTCEACSGVFYRFPREIIEGRILACSLQCGAVLRWKYRPMITMESVIQRFWSKVDKTPGIGPEGTCWDWKGEVGTHGYGKFWHQLEYKRVMAHRFSFMLSNPEITLPKNRNACHTCDRKICVNPNHLFKGSAKDNSDDKVKKGRQSRIFTDEQVLDIRFNYPEITSTELAPLFGVTSAAIRAIRDGRTGKTLPLNYNYKEEVKARKLLESKKLK